LHTKNIPRVLYNHLTSAIAGLDLGLKNRWDCPSKNKKSWVLEKEGDKNIN